MALMVKFDDGKGKKGKGTDAVNQLPDKRPQVESDRCEPWEEADFLFNALENLSQLFTEETLKRQSDRCRERVAVLEAVFAHVPVGIIMLDTELKYHRINAYAAGVIGLCPEEIAGRQLGEVLAGRVMPEIVQQWLAIFKHVLAAGEPFIVRNWSVPKYLPSGKPLYLDIEVWRVDDERGEPVGLLLTMADVTRHVLDKQALEEMEEELIRHRDRLQELVEEQTAKLKAVNKALEVANAELLEENRWRREAEETNLRLAAIVNSSSDAVISGTLDGTILTWNPGAERIYGYTAGEIIGRPITILGQPELHETDVKKMLEKIAQGEIVKNDEAVQLRKDGKRIYVSFSISPLRDTTGVVKGFSTIARDITEQKEMQEALCTSHRRFVRAFNFSPLLQALMTLEDGRYLDVNERFEQVTGYCREEILGRTSQELNIWVRDEDRLVVQQALLSNGFLRNLEIEFRTKAGEVRTGLVSAVVIELDGKRCVLKLVLDITERKHYERELARLDRLYLVGEMAASISHEIRNPLTTVHGFLQFLAGKKKYSQDREYFALMLEELNRASAIINEFLSLARNKAVQLKAQSLNGIINNLFPLLQADAMKDDKCVAVFLGEVPGLLLDEKEIRQLILNLVRNGLEAMEPGGKLTITTYCEQGEVVLAVADEGKGIPTEILHKLGTPFFTTKENGTGLGLAVCYSIASRHGAAIDIKTSPHGTTFFVRFKIGAE